MKIEFKMTRFNERRAMRGAEAAEYQISENGEVADILWMSKKDIENNIRDFPDADHSDLELGLEGYKGKSICIP